MKIAQYYSHLNGFEWLAHHHPGYWEEVCDAIAAVDAQKCKVKKSKEKNILGKMLYHPESLNDSFRKELRSRGWGRAGRRNYWVTDDAALMRQAMPLQLAQQKEVIESAGARAIKTWNEADFEKDRISIEVQFGKYSFVQFDLFIKHAANYMQDKIDLGIEIVPMKVMEEEMSSGPLYYEKHLHEILRQGRIFPPVPLILIGVEP